MTLTSISGLVPGAAKSAFNVGMKASATTSWLALKNNNACIQLRSKFHPLYYCTYCTLYLLYSVPIELMVSCCCLTTLCHNKMFSVALVLYPDLRLALSECKQWQTSAL